MATGNASRGQWASQFGFVMAAVGSAVGLGNMWRFPYQMAEAGGAAFLMLYIGMVLLIGLPIMLAEFALGRGSRQSPIKALEHFGGRRWRPLGVLFVITGFVILAYYSVIAGWVIRYSGVYLFSGLIAEPGAAFETFATGPYAVLLQIVFMAGTMLIVMGGIEKGIERAAVFLMPLLFLIVGGIAIYAATLEGAGGGYAFYLQTDFGQLLSWGVLSSAAGQAFFSLSLGMGAMLTYSSYLSRNENLPRESTYIAGADFIVAFVAGLMVFPLIFALGLAGEVGESTVGALFITLPEAFSRMGVIGRIVGLMFFVALLVGAVTSAISLLEVVTSSAIDGLGWSRKQATLVMGGAITLLGIPCALNLTYLEIYDQVAGTVFLVIGALLTAIFVGWQMADPLAEVARGARQTGFLPAWRAILKYVVPPILVFVLVFTVFDVFTTLRELLGL